MISFKPNCVLLLLLLVSSSGYSQTAAQILEKAYKKESAEQLKQFFETWHTEIPSATQAELSHLNDTLRQAYRVFNAFYKPHRTDSLGGSEWGNDIYKNIEYLIVQNFVKIYFAEKVYYDDKEVEDSIVAYVKSHIADEAERQNLLRKKDGKLPPATIRLFGPNRLRPYAHATLVDSITDFRPSISCNGKSPLYLNSRYNGLLNSFLGNKHTPLGAGGIMNPARSKGQSKKRKDFLERYIKIWYGHWGGYWQLLSYPSAYSITFDKDMNYAIVDFRMVYEGGEAILKNDNGHWEIITARRTWIE
jgi:hypothetical protein